MTDQDEVLAGWREPVGLATDEADEVLGFMGHAKRHQSAGYDGSLDAEPEDRSSVVAMTKDRLSELSPKCATSIALGSNAPADTALVLLAGELFAECDALLDKKRNCSTARLAYQETRRHLGCLAQIIKTRRELGL